MVALADRLSHVLRDNVELDTAVAQLVKKQSPPQGDTPQKENPGQPVETRPEETPTRRNAETQKEPHQDYSQ